MTFKKGFNIGYFVYLIVLFLVFYFVPIASKIWTALGVTVLFGVYQMILSSKLKSKKGKTE